MDTYKEILEKFLTDYPELAYLEDTIKDAYFVLCDCHEHDATVFACGNGGSAADSEHIVGELMKGFNRRRPLCAEKKAKFSAVPGGDEIASCLQTPIRAISLVSQCGLFTACANDISPDLVFSQQLLGYTRSEYDVLFALSTSGSSVNVVNAAITAKALGCKVISITGDFPDSKLAGLANIRIMLPRKRVYEIQELTLPVYHVLCAMLESRFFAE